MNDEVQKIQRKADADLQEKIRSVSKQLREFEAAQRAKRTAGKPKPITKGVLRHMPRNGPCPCGSGKKWKQCHGGTR